MFTDIKSEHLLAEVFLKLGLKALKRERNCLVASSGDNVPDTIAVIFKNSVTIFVTHCDEEKNIEDISIEGDFSRENLTNEHCSRVRERIKSRKKFRLKPGHVSYSSDDEEFYLSYSKYGDEKSGDFVDFE